MENWSISLGRPIFPENFVPSMKIMVQPSPRANSACMLLSYMLDRVDYYTEVDGYMFESIVLACLLS